MFIHKLIIKKSSFLNLTIINLLFIKNKNCYLEKYRYIIIKK